MGVQAMTRQARYLITLVVAAGVLLTALAGFGGASAHAAILTPGQRAATSATPVSGSYGHPYFCGDGDGDGWDMPCPALHHSTPAPVTRHLAIHTTALHTAASAQSLGARIYAEARTRAGDWYVWGGDGPTVFDCSGIVHWAAHQLGVNMPRDTYSMLSTGVATGILVPTRNPRPGDLAFFGTGHVEFVAGHDLTFGAQRSGTQVGYHRWYPGSWWVPSAFYRIV